MILLELRFTDDPRRLTARAAHRRRLQELHRAGALVMAGPFADDSGALLVFDVDDEQLDAVVASDPYYATAGVTVVGRRTWNPLPLT